MSKKVNDALKKYYSTLGYDTGVKAFKRGGNIGFTPSKFPNGGDLLHDPESLYGLYLRGQYGYGKLENPTVITPESTQTLAEGKTLRTPKKSEFDWSSLLEGDQGQSSLSLGKNVNMSTPWSAIAGTAGSLTVDLQRLIDAQIRKNDSHVYNPLVSAGLAKGGRKFDGGGFSSSPMDIAGSAVKIVANAVNQASLTTDYDVFQDAVNRYTANQISSINGITDNDSLMNAYANMYQLSDNIKGRDFRDKTVLGDITDGLASSFEGFNATGNWIGAVVGGVSSNIGSIIGRIRANKAANRAEGLVRKRNQEIDTRLFHASQDVDRRNDIMRMIGYYNDPFEYAYGGEMRTHGSDFNNGLTFINEGGRHEDNPYEGVPSGVDADGIPNLVEEGEVIWNDEYVFSDRLKVPETLSKKYNLGGEKTFAEAIKEVTKESLTRPNDPISNETNRAIVNEFMDAQEALREAEQAKAAKQVQTAYDEDFMNQLATLSSQGEVPMQEGLQLPPQEMNEEGIPIEGAPAGFALGGNKFDGGGWEDFFNIIRAYKASLNPSAAAGRYAIDRNAEYWNNLSAAQVEDKEAYKAFTKYVEEHPNDPKVLEYFRLLDEGINTKKGAKKLLKKDGTLSDTWKETFNHRRTDKALGIYHLSPTDVAFLTSGNAEVQPSKQEEPASPSGPKEKIEALNAAIEATRETQQGSTTSQKTQSTPATPKFEYEPTWQRMAPVYGAGAMALYGMLGRPNYENADAIIEAARAAGVPVNIPVQTIGDYRVRKPYDERYLVNMANQNRAAGQRSIYNTSGGNRAMDMLGAMSLAYNSQLDLGEIMRQAYLANRQDDAQVAEFNRGTNIQNMNAINQRNLAQAQLNSQRQATALSGISRGYGVRQGIKDNWDAATMQSINSLLTSLGAIGKENEENNILKSMAEQGYFPYYYGDRSVLQNVPRTVNKNGGNKLNKKKRRF